MKNVNYFFILVACVTSIMVSCNRQTDDEQLQSHISKEQQEQLESFYSYSGNDSFVKNITGALLGKPTTKATSLNKFIEKYGTAYWHEAIVMRDAVGLCAMVVPVVSLDNNLSGLVYANEYLDKMGRRQLHSWFVEKSKVHKLDYTYHDMALYFSAKLELNDAPYGVKVEDMAQTKSQYRIEIVEQWEYCFTTYGVDNKTGEILYDNGTRCTSFYVSTWVYVMVSDDPFSMGGGYNPLMPDLAFDKIDNILQNKNIPSAKALAITHAINAVRNSGCLGKRLYDEIERGLRDNNLSALAGFYDPNAKNPYDIAGIIGGGMYFGNGFFNLWSDKRLTVMAHEMFHYFAMAAWYPFIDLTTETHRLVTEFSAYTFQYLFLGYNGWIGPQYHVPKIEGKYLWMNGFLKDLGDKTGGYSKSISLEDLNSLYVKYAPSFAEMIGLSNATPQSSSYLMALYDLINKSVNSSTDCLNIKNKK